jgi:hypothetical protein
MRKVYWVILIVIILLRLGDSISTYIEVCRMNWTELNISFISQTYRFGFIISSMISMVIWVSSFLLCAFFFEKIYPRIAMKFNMKLKFKWMIPIFLASLFIFYGILPLLFNVQSFLNFSSRVVTRLTLGILEKNKSVASARDVENFNRTSFCRMI